MNDRAIRAYWYGTVLGFLAGIIIMLAVAGCASNPTQRYAQVQDSYIAAVTILVEARAAGDIEEEVWQRDILPLINLGDRALDQYGAAVRGGESTVESREAIYNIVQQLRPFVYQYTIRKQ